MSRIEIALVTSPFNEICCWPLQLTILYHWHLQTLSFWKLFLHKSVNVNNFTQQQESFSSVKSTNNKKSQWYKRGIVRIQWQSSAVFDLNHFESLESFIRRQLSQIQPADIIKCYLPETEGMLSQFVRLFNKNLSYLARQQYPEKNKI